jgi:hypothetical protein
MDRRNARGRIVALIGVMAISVAATLPLAVFGQGGGGGRGGGGRGGGGRGGPPATAEASAPLDLTGYWVSLVTEDWRFRMVTPAKGDYASVPISPAGRTLADQWDPDKDTAAGLQCKSYGAAGLMRVPTRLHITWADENTLKVETDAGTQTRLLHFGTPTPPAGDAGLQGFSLASWDGVGRGGRGFGGGGGGGGGGGAANAAVINAGVPGGVLPAGAPPAAASPAATQAAGRGGAPAIRPGSLKVVTTHLSPGYLRKNGVPYGANTTLTEYFDRTYEPNGDSLLIVTTIVDDPEYLTGQFITSTHFKRLADAGPGWNPTPCEAK